MANLDTTYCANNECPSYEICFRGGNGHPYVKTGNVWHRRGEELDPLKLAAPMMCQAWFQHDPQTGKCELFGELAPRDTDHA